MPTSSATETPDDVRDPGAHRGTPGRSGPGNHGADDADDAGRMRPPWRERLRGAMPWAGPPVALLFGMKAALVLLGVATVETFNGIHLASFADWLEVWNRWDATNYTSIAQFGYQTTGEAQFYAVFLPGYPAAVRIAHDLLPGSYLGAAFVVSTLASTALVVLLAALARHDSGGDTERATRAVWFLLVFPTAYFLHVPYTESLFLSLVLGAFLAARTGHWATAGIVGALAAVTRINGLLLLPALALEAYLQYRRDGRIRRSWAWIGAVALGTAAYLAVNANVYGDPLHFQAVQESHWYKRLQDPFTSVKALVGTATTQAKAGDALMVGWAEVVFLAIGLVAGIVTLLRSRASYAVWILLNVLLFASTSWIQSTPRYVITLFPIFLLLAGIRRPWVRMLVTAWSLMAMTFFAARYALGNWAF